VWPPRRDPYINHQVHSHMPVQCYTKPMIRQHNKLLAHCECPANKPLENIHNLSGMQRTNTCQCDTAMQQTVQHNISPHHSVPANYQCCYTLQSTSCQSSIVLFGKKNRNALQTRCAFASTLSKARRTTPIINNLFSPDHQLNTEAGDS
jgi:hypothetical protein